MKGVEFGAGFGVANLRGSQNNDPFTVKDGKIVNQSVGVQPKADILALLD